MPAVARSVIALFGIVSLAMPGARADGPAAVLQKCVKCHNGDKLAGGLDLGSRPKALSGGDSGPALVPGDAAKSLLFKQVSTRKMPPKEPLVDADVEVVRRWIADGAKWPTLTAPKGEQRAGADWWSLQPVRRPAVPRITVHHPIDSFIQAKLSAEGLTPAPPADRVTLIRRVTFDLHGLPPTPEEIDAFVNDRSADAWEKLIDRLLASPRYGERWGRHWLDVARFAESQGFERDKVRDHAWRYRDYVIQSFNDDKPYDRFVMEQIAGDVLSGATRDGVAATAFLVAGPWDEAGSGSVSASVRAKIREEELEDMLSAVSQTFLGITANCARCHDHKFDPIPQKDYYRLKAVFDGVRHGDRPLMTAAELRDRAERLAQLDRAIAEQEGMIAGLERIGREEANPASAPAIEPPRPVSRWTFEQDARDDFGRLNGTLHGGAKIANGRLVLDGKGAFVETADLPTDLREKTLEAWMTLANRGQRGGGVMSVQVKGGGIFDAIVYGEREPGRWMAGSEFFRRTRPLHAPAESAGPGELIHLALAYFADGRVALYRNGRPHGEPYKPDGPESGLRNYPAGESQLLFGLRHSGGGNAFLAGEIEEARLYDRALTAAQVEASFRAGPRTVALAEILAALSPEQRRQRDAAVAEVAKLKGRREQVAAFPAFVYAANPKQPEPTAILLRGDIDKKGEIVSAGGLSAVKSPSADFGLAADAPEAERRLKFAQWLTVAEQPLTARVMVNRVWHYHFGRGIVDTPNDFGFNGGRPSHPELLDWLASEFVAGGWSVKALHRLILQSQTYQQSSRFDPAAAEKDADDRLLWRFAPRRLEAEAVRDAMLAVAGRLVHSGGGPGFRPFKVTVFNSSFYDLIDDDRPDFRRRTVYRTGVNSAKDPLLESFDCPEPSVKAPRRNVTTTPLQALGLMNNAFVQRQAKRLTERVRDAGDVEAQARQMYRLTLGRPPTDAELRRAAALAREHGAASLAWVLLNASEFLYVR
ncbi:MAG: DUF1553 domain-containing protein [Gemmataceae bacterium]